MSVRINKNQNFLIDTEIIELSLTKQLIKQFDESLLSGCSYDLRVGNIVRSRSRLTKIDIETKEFFAQSGECFTIETLEEVNLRDNILYGLIFNKHSVLGKGLFHPATTVDPGFIGPLSITFFNLGNTPIKIEKGMKICSIHFQPIHANPKLIYGTTQRPSYKEGDSQYTLNFENPEIELSDVLLSKMYGAPISRLYDKFSEIESRFNLKSLTKDEELRKEKRQKSSELRAAFIGAIVGSLISFALQFLLAQDGNSSKIENQDKENNHIPKQESVIDSNSFIESQKDIYNKNGSNKK